MANPEHLARLAQGRQAWDRWRHEETERRRQASPHGGFKTFVPDLSQACLSGGDFKGFDLSHVNLKRADLRDANLDGAMLFCSNLDHADLSHANCTGVVFGEAHFTFYRDERLSWAPESSWHQAIGPDLTAVNFEGAYLVYATFERVELDGANFTAARLRRTKFIEMDLAHVKGLELADHRGPSFIDTSTFFRSGGRIPDAFMRGCGLPDSFITYAQSLVGVPIEFYSCFISYSTNDHGFAERLYADLQNQGVRCWFAPHDIQGGRKIHEQIDQAIRVYDRLLVILSENSMNSEWVRTEITHARQKELNEDRQVLFPISLVPFEEIRKWRSFDGDTGKDLAREIREYFIPDFSSWKNHDSYLKTFQRLMHDLKAAKGQASTKDCE